MDLKPHDEWRFASKDALVDSMSGKLAAAIPGLPTNFSQVIQDSVEESLSGAKGEIAVKVFGPQPRRARGQRAPDRHRAQPHPGRRRRGRACRWAGRASGHPPAPRRAGPLRHQRDRRERDDPDRPRRQRGQCVLRRRPPLRRDPALRRPLPRPGWTTSPTCRWPCPTAAAASRWATWPTWSCARAPRASSARPAAAT